MHTENLVPPLPQNGLSPPSTGYINKKNKILQNLATPDDQYTDFSPKGSVDEGVKDLIHEINAYEGLVTTSSCAGRISVFLEGHKRSTGPSPDTDEPSNSRSSHQTAVPGGKGIGGRWLFVSHLPLPLSTLTSLLELFQLSPPSTTHSVASPPGGPLRLIRFQFEPMILHIMAASLSHAQPALAAALSAGFRESGVQSLKALSDQHAFPMVAVRSAGLGLESVVGCVGPGGEARALVGEEYLRLLVRLGNERFVANAERIDRFRSELRNAVGGSGRGSGSPGNWEGCESRARRKRAEGLARRAEMNGDSRDENVDLTKGETVDVDDVVGVAAFNRLL